MNLLQELKNYAVEIGLAGLAAGPATPLDEAEARLRDRISKGFAGHYGLTQGNEDRFTHPEKILPGAKTIISCALSYYRPSKRAAEDDERLLGEVARFAVGRDYHKVMRGKLEQIVSFLRQRAPGAACEILVDTGPMLDRAAAARSGLGWFGKNACIIVPEYGSWVVLGEIITDAEMERDKPWNGHLCGPCELCRIACPTGAIVSEFEIDLNRCISHLTQMGGIVPRALRRYMGTMVYGCDICQEVCPQNMNARSCIGTKGSADALKFPSPVDLVALLEIGNREFDETVGRSAAGWIGRNRIRRNACIALGNLGSPLAVPALIKAVHSQSSLVRAHAAWALGQIGGESRFILEKRLKNETDEEVLEEIREALSGNSGKNLE